MAPAMVGPHAIGTRVMRRGSSMSTWAATLADADGAAVASMVAITGSPRRAVRTHQGSVWGTASAPVVPAAEGLARAPSDPPFPGFMRNLDMRPAFGTPMSGEPAASVGWLRLVEEPMPSEAMLLALVDAWWPASLAMLDEMPRVATVSFTANLLVDPATVRADDLFIHESFVTAAADGFASEHRRLWTADGRLAVDNLQTMVVGS